MSIGWKQPLWNLNRVCWGFWLPGQREPESGSLGRNVWIKELLFSPGGHNQSGISRLGFKHYADVSQKICQKGERLCLSDKLSEMNVLPLFQQSAGKVTITNNSNRKACWVSWFECWKHNECPLYPGTSWLSYPDVVVPKLACDREVMCEADMAETVWFLLTASAYSPQATALSAPQPSWVPICKPNAEHYKLFRDWSCVSACNRPEECSKGYKPVTQ